MDKVTVWFYILLTVGLALFANSVSAVWGEQKDKFKSWWLVPVIILSPLVFVTFGLTANKIGVAISSATIDVILAVSTVFIGLIFFREWKQLSVYQYLGVGMTVIGVIFTQI
jgi:multidrug transporter EmrE-like cation transporter